MKTFIIRLKENELSNRLAQETYDSCVNLNIFPNYYDGVVIKEYSEITNSYNLNIDESQKALSLGTFGCFLSHWLLWKECSVQKESFLILEHDAVVLKNPKEIESGIIDVCHLDAFIPFNSNLPFDSEEYYLKYNELCLEKKEGISPYPLNKFYSGDSLTSVTGCNFKGAYGYLLKPSAAKKLVIFCDKYGALPADRALCEKVLFLQRSNSTYVRLNSFFKSLKIQRDYTTRI